MQSIILALYVIVVSMKTDFVRYNFGVPLAAKCRDVSA